MLELVKMGEYIGVIVGESLKDSNYIERFKVINSDTTPEENEEARWHIYTVEASKEQIESLSKELKEGWYAHFWIGRDLIVIFKDKIFEFNYDDKESWKDAVEYGLSVGIPKEQLDFTLS